MPTETLNDLTKFLSMPQEDIEFFLDILGNDKNTTVMDIYLDIINIMKCNDDDAFSLYSVYKYIEYIIKERDFSFSDLIPEFEHLLQTNFDESSSKKIIENIHQNSKLFNALFEEISIESKNAKRLFLSSGTFNSVAEIRSICDFRPVFNPKRTDIDEYIPCISFEFTVKDSIGNLKIIPLSFSMETFKDLEDEMNNINNKKKIMDEKIKIPE